MRRALTLLTILVLAAAVFLVVRTPDQEPRTSGKEGPKPEKTVAVRRNQERDRGGAETTRAGTTLANSSEKPCPDEQGGRGETTQEEEIQIGKFARPKNVPKYEILDDKKVSRDCAHAVQLLVNTTSRSQEDYELIARDIKARYREYDAVSVEFIDTDGLLDYHGSALIFNTPAGSTYLGYVYGPINTRGYYVSAAD